MCGITGILHGDPRAQVDPAMLRRMTDTLVHRGPDESGLHRIGPAGLGHRRLSIIDLASGQQPMVTEDDRIALTFNGEIYNYRELRTELLELGHRFHTDSDTEVILRLYQDRGASCVEHLRGMFAFAIWDATKQRLLLARDRVGIKPVYWALTADALVFGSELKAVLAADGVDDRLDAQAVDDYFSHAFIRAPRTIFAGVNKLEAGHLLTATLGASSPGGRSRPQVATHRYWALPEHGRPSPAKGLSEVRARDELLRHLEDAVRMRLMSEVPLGAFLSGGLDSSTVVWLMSRVSSDPVRTFSIGFHERDFDERNVARVVARRFGTRHEEEVVTPDAVASLPHVLAAHDEPFGDPSSIPTWYLCRMARKHVTVCLSGDGGDELFAGYRRHGAIHRERRFTGRLPRQALALVSRLGCRMVAPESGHRSQLVRLGLADAEAHYGRYRAIFSPAMRRQLFTHGFQRRMDMAETARLFAKIHPATRRGDTVSPLLASDFTMYLPDDILTKVDRMSMAHSLECRVPLLDHRVVEFVTRLPISLKLRNGVSKVLLRSLIEPHLPPETIAHRKQGFSVPIRAWLKNELRGVLEEAIHGPTLRQSGYFQPTYLRHLQRIHQTGRNDLSWHLWQILVFTRWLEHHRPASPA